MKTQMLDYDLPAELIAQQPADSRTDSRLLAMNRADNSLLDCRFSDICALLNAGDCLVVNNTRVLPARFFARRKSGAEMQGLFLQSKGPRQWNVMLKNSRRIKIGEVIELLDRHDNCFLNVHAGDKLPDGTRLLDFDEPVDPETVLDEIGFTPLPPYISRDRDLGRDEFDRQRYQTVYARHGGAVAAPTAGLHFTEQLLNQIAEMGVSVADVTLEVGAGTFKPVSVDNLAEHKIHSETYQLDEKNADIINRARSQGGRIIAVGTTSVRTLETCFNDGSIRPGSGQTQLFIMPGYQFKAVDAMITNFHLPRSTLLALVAAFAGLEPVLDAYRHAVRQRYRFYSYGDAMFIY